MFRILGLRLVAWHKAWALSKGFVRQKQRTGFESWTGVSGSGVASRQWPRDTLKTLFCTFKQPGGRKGGIILRAFGLLGGSCNGS